MCEIRDDACKGMDFAANVSWPVELLIASSSPNRNFVFKNLHSLGFLIACGRQNSVHISCRKQVIYVNNILISIFCTINI